MRFRVNTSHLTLAVCLSLPVTGFITLGSLPAHAQSTSGNLVGVVKDPTGAAVPNASLTLRNEATGVKATATTNSQGQYRFDNLLPGSYTIVSSVQGFSSTTVKAITVSINSSATQDVTMSVGGNTSTVEVSADSGITLDTTTQNLTTTFDNAQLSTLPVASIGQGVLNTSLLAPGVGSTGGVGIGVGPSIAGQRPRNNNFTIEGIDNNDKSVTGPLVYVPNDAVGEFTLITTQFSPEFGHSSGGQFNTNITSGTNHFHGKLYEYFRNRNLDAAGGSAGSKVVNPGYDYNRYGGQIGGPIKRDKLFFFANFERNTTRVIENPGICTPTAAGIATIAGLASTPGYSANNIQQYLKYTNPATLTDDASINTYCSGPTITLTSGPASSDDGSQTGATEATIPVGAFRPNALTFSNFNSFNASADYTISPQDSFRLRYIYNTESSTDTAAQIPTFYQQQPFKYHLVALSEYHNFTPNLINEARLGYNRYYNTTDSGPFQFPGLDQFPTMYFYDLGFASYGPDGNAPQFTIQNLYQFTDNISYTKGRHTLKFGFDGRKYISPQGFTQRARGDYEWSYLSDYLHDFASDNGAGAERSAGSFTYYGDQTEFYGYANDTWRATDKLTLNAGVRYEYTSVPTGERTQGLNSVADTPGVITFGVPQPVYTNVAPRIGIEFAPDSKTSVRLGYGIAYDTLFDNLGILSAPPQLQQTQDVGSAGSCIGYAACPDYGSPNFLANGGLHPGPPGITVLDRDTAISKTSGYITNTQVPPYSENYTLTVQREITKGITAEVGYIGNRGIHLPVQIQYNVQPRTNLTNYLPTYVNGVALNGRGSNATTLNAISPSTADPNVPADGLNIKPGFLAAGFRSAITAYEPYGGSNYNGLITNLQGRLHNGLQLNLSYTWSKAMDDSTAEVFATTLTPRRPQDPTNMAAEYSRSALDHTHRVTLEAVYDFKPFKNGNWLMRNVVGNWTVSPIYTYESPEFATVLGGSNGLLTGDGPYVGRTIINPNGVKGTGSAIMARKNGAGQIIGYDAKDPNAYYIQAGSGALPNSSRNTLPGRPTDNLDASAYKRFAITERYSFEFGAQAFNALNHAQYIPGSVDDVGAYSYTNLPYVTVGNPQFNHPELVFSNNPRILQLSGKLNF